MRMLPLSAPAEEPEAKPKITPDARELLALLGRAGKPVPGLEIKERLGWDQSRVRNAALRATMHGAVWEDKVEGKIIYGVLD